MSAKRDIEVRRVPRRRFSASLQLLVGAGLFCSVFAANSVKAQPVLSEAEQQYVQARRAESEGRKDEAERLYAGLARGLPTQVLADVRARRARLLASLERCREARPLLAQLSSRADKLVLAGCLAKLRQWRPAIELLETLRAQGREDADVLLRLAEAQTALNARAPAAELLSRVWTHFPGTARDRRVAQMRTKLRIRERPTLEARFSRVERLIALRDPQLAVTEADAIARPTKRADRAMWLHWRGMARFSAKRYSDAIAILDEAARMNGPTAAEDAFHHARALGRIDRDREAVEAYDAMARTHASHALAHEAKYRAARLMLTIDAADAVARYERFLRDARAGAEYVQDAHFELGMAHFDRAQFAPAAVAFARYAATEEAGMVRGRGAYWAGRSFDALGDRAQAEQNYRQAIAADPLHWYALLAMKRLTALGLAAAPFPATSAAPSPGTDASWVPQLPDLAAFYARLGFNDDAINVVRNEEDAIKRAAPAGRQEEALARLYSQLGAVHRAYEVAMRQRALLRQAPNPATQWIWDAAYPRAWSDAVQAGMRDNSVPPDLLYALMRQESGYDPKVVSHADAVGLIQLLPSTAARVAQGLGMTVTRNDLFAADINIKLAARYIGNLLRMYQSDAPQLAIAAYNAGEARVSRWRTSLGTQELDLWVERMPIDETRNYVRRVTGHWARYRYLAGDTLTVPDDATSLAP